MPFTTVPATPCAAGGITVGVGAMLQPYSCRSDLPQNNRQKLCAHPKLRVPKFAASLIRTACVCYHLEMDRADEGSQDLTSPASEATAPAGSSGPRRAWSPAPPGRLVGRGHPAGDFLDAFDWDVLEERSGYLKLRATLPERVKNPRGQLFGGFTPTYVDLVALFTVRAGMERASWRQGGWLATTNMRVDYFEPIVGPTFIIESTRERQRGRTHFVATRFFQDAELAVFALTTMREVRVDRPLGDA